MQRPLQITYKGLDRSDALDALITRRVASLEALHARLIGCRVVVEVPHRGAESGKVAIAVSVEVDIAGRPALIGKAQEERREAKEDQTAAFNAAFNAVERQVERIAEQRRETPRGGGSAGEEGMIVRLFRDEGYGFVQIDNSPVLSFSRNAVAGDDFDALQDGMMVHVTRASDEGPMGPQASSVRLLNKRMAPH